MPQATSSTGLIYNLERFPQIIKVTKWTSSKVIKKRPLYSIYYVHVIPYVEARCYHGNTKELKFYQVNIMELKFYQVNIMELKFYQVNIMELKFYQVNIMEQN